MAHLSLRRLCGLLLGLAALVGCRSVLNLPPLQEPRGGFTVLAGLPDQPTIVRVFADVGAFATQRGFGRVSVPSTTQVDSTTQQPVPSGTARYQRGTLKLEVFYDAARLRVAAYLHGPGGEGERRSIREFSRDFQQAYAGSYGGNGFIAENTFDEEASRSPGGGRVGGGNPGGPGSSPAGGGH